MWPSFASRLGRGLNRRLLRRQLLSLIRSMPEAPVAVTTIPLVADLIGELPVRRWVYYCVDDFGVWPGLDAAPLQSMEQELIRKADVHIAVSEVLRRRLAEVGKPVALLTHGVDVPFWSSAAPVPAVLNDLERPLIVFWGLLDRRLNLETLRALSTTLASGTIVLTGPQDDPGPELATLPRVVRTGPIPFEQLPGLAREAAVLVMPYADLPVTRAIQPLKLKEYLATGRPVVVADLPANREWADCLDIAGTPADFAHAVAERAAGGLPETQRAARVRLGAESWHEKARIFERLLDGREME